MALGATPASLRCLVLAESAKLALFGLAGQETRAGEAHALRNAWAALSGKRVTIFFNAFPRFDYNVTALKSRTRVLKQRTKLRLKFVRDLAATRQIKTVKSLHPIPFDGTLFIRDLSCSFQSYLA
jgi:hypothetical protein